MPVPPRASRPLIAAALAVVAVAVVFRVGMLVTLHDGDTELFVYMGKLVGQGGRIGRELIDNKLPSVGLLMWPAYALVGAWWPGYWLIGLLLGVVTVAAVTRAGARVYAESFWPTLAVAATWMSFPMAVFCSFKLEHVQTATAAVAAYFVVRCHRRLSNADAWLAGLVAGFGAYAKPSALAVIVAAGVSMACWRQVHIAKRARLIAAMLAGVAVPVVVLAVYLVRSGAIATFPDAYTQVRAYTAGSVIDMVTTAWKLIFVAFMIATPLLMRWIVERRGRLTAAEGSGELLLFAGMWLALEAAGIVMQGRMYAYHFLPLGAPAALLFGLIPRRPRAMAVIGSCAPLLVVAAYWFWFATLATQPPTNRMAAMDYVKAHAQPHDGVWLDQYARLLVESDLKPGSAIPLTFIFSNDDAAPTRFGAILCSDLRRRTPRWIILPADCVAQAEYYRKYRPEYSDRPARGAAFVAAWARIETYVREAYAPVATFGDTVVYERRVPTETADVR